MGTWDDDDIEIGNVEIGESHRGLQDSALMGAARQLAALKGQIQQAAGGRLSRHVPVQKQLRSPYKDSTQIGILAQATFTPSVFDGGTNPTAVGRTRVYKSFKPEKAVITELVEATYTTSGGDSVKRYAKVPSAGDCVLISAFSGADNCFPNAPSDSEGIDCETFANNALGVGISWPTINGGIDMTVQFSIQGSVLAQTETPDATYTLTSVKVSIRMMLLGPSLR